jgi:hypothetical protein
MAQGTGHVLVDTEVAVLRAGGDYRLLLTHPVAADTYLFDIVGVPSDRPTRYTVQVAESMHIDLPADCNSDEALDRYFWRFMNHSCDPTAVIRGRGVYSLRALDAWSEVTFNYNTTEYDMAEPFRCRCGSGDCQRLVRGFRHLSSTEQQRLRPHLADHLRSLLDPGVAVQPPLTAA